MVRWAVELSEFNIQYESRGSIKGQVYADFVAELSRGGEQEVEAGSRGLLSVDGSSNLQGSGAGIVLEGPNGVLIEQALRFAFRASNNQAEYEALIAGMLLAKEMSAQNLLVKSDSQLITGQVSGEFQAKDPQMAAYLQYVQLLRGAFNALELVHVPREHDPAGNSNMEESLRSTLGPVYATAFSTGSPLEPSLGSPNVTCKTHRRRL
ncbi:uncharacterized protein [Phaseolus vulgaris]|uniref:uncharacterized protein n=1 Tax=Phaseolus vulgaris TaxID=3885 RepID=UPI0035CAE5A6